MRIKLFFILAISGSLFTQDIVAQNDASTSMVSKVSTYADLTVAASANTYSAAVGIYRTHGLFAGKRIRVGYGLRAHGFGGSDLDFVTAPARLTLADPPLLDTFNVGSPISGGVNAVIHLGYLVTPKFFVGFNIDAIGVGFGATTIGTFSSSDDPTKYPLAARATPTGVNVLLVGDNDIGQLKSQLTLAYHVTDKFMASAGADFHFSEYTTVNELTNQNDRFRYKALMGFAGVSYLLGSK